ncbi:MAG: thiamine biosynthesis protein ApbE [Moraxellaceae bacterium]|nr:MAG: thiamine biosynthesis protein ApbE [Moraxellaceae bacterium]
MTFNQLHKSTITKNYNLIKSKTGWKFVFNAMASPCEIILTNCSRKDAERLSKIAVNETKRIEMKFSRYRDDNIVYEVNNSNGRTVSIDEEISRLLVFADQCHKASNGLFDITSGILRKVWLFDGSSEIPKNEDVTEILCKVGWEKVHWDSKSITLAPGMELDFGGIGKEYAVDRVLLMLTENHNGPILVNFGGDIATNGTLFPNQNWNVGIEAVGNKKVTNLLNVKGGAIATSGDARRFLLRDGIRYSHILNPKNGWPVKDAPHSITVAAPGCLQAGMLSTIALLQGAHAERFLDDNSITYCSQR